MHDHNYRPKSNTGGLLKQEGGTILFNSSFKFT